MTIELYVPIQGWKELFQHGNLDKAISQLSRSFKFDAGHGQLSGVAGFSGAHSTWLISYFFTPASPVWTQLRENWLIYLEIIGA